MPSCATSAVTGVSKKRACSLTRGPRTVFIGRTGDNDVTHLTTLRDSPWSES